ncbi:hypothetical protein C8Q76DRAFT_313243 [Earliella scabrosa]|nr:hypothetical protein C8Q76DRAFT_313243 [Earliella scabrosa]
MSVKIRKHTAELWFQLVACHIDLGYAQCMRETRVVESTGHCYGDVFLFLVPEGPDIVTPEGWYSTSQHTPRPRHAPGPGSVKFVSLHANRYGYRAACMY